jgi:hypothetical protein
MVFGGCNRRRSLTVRGIIARCWTPEVLVPVGPAAALPLLRGLEAPLLGDVRRLSWRRNPGGEDLGRLGALLPLHRPVNLADVRLGDGDRAALMSGPDAPGALGARLLGAAAAPDVTRAPVVGGARLVKTVDALALVASGPRGLEHRAILVALGLVAEALWLLRKRWLLLLLLLLMLKLLLLLLLLVVDVRGPMARCLLLPKAIAGLAVRGCAARLLRTVDSPAVVATCAADIQGHYVYSGPPPFAGALYIYCGDFRDFGER